MPTLAGSAEPHSSGSSRNRPDYAGATTLREGSAFRCFVDSGDEARYPCLRPCCGRAAGTGETMDPVRLHARSLFVLVAIGGAGLAAGMHAAPGPLSFSLAAAYALVGGWVFASLRNLGTREVRSDAEPPSGARIERETPYVLEEKLGAGQMGEVWRAHHRTLRRRAAVKRIRAAEVGEVDLARFKREARATAALRSPHTIAVYDFGLLEGKEFFYAMELLDGLDLQTFVERYGPLSPARVVWILRQALLSLAEAHDHGLVHRDVKPANIMLCRYGGQFDFVKVLDFGLVKADTIDGTSTNLTRDFAMVGTAAYFAPESRNGSKQVDARADLYAMGCIAFWLLTGRLVFERNRIMEMIQAHLLEKPARVRSIAPDVPEELDALVSDALEKDPSKRVASAREFLKRLERVPLVEPWSEERAQLWWASSGVEPGPEAVPLPSLSVPPRAR